MILNEYGRIVEGVWQELPKRYENVELDYYTIMPNHFHGIIIVGAVHEPPKSVRAIHESPLRNRRRMTLSMTVGYFKMNSAKCINTIRKTPGNFIWQRNYYDHIIRNDADLNRVRQYIEYNPVQWADDAENPALRQRLEALEKR